MFKNTVCDTIVVDKQASFLNLCQYSLKNRHGVEIIVSNISYHISATQHTHVHTLLLSGIYLLIKYFKVLFIVHIQ